jgi:hypothetical protein
MKVIISAAIMLAMAERNQNNDHGRDHGRNDPTRGHDRDHGRGHDRGHDRGPTKDPAPSPSPSPSPETPSVYDGPQTRESWGATFCERWPSDYYCRAK